MRDFIMPKCPEKWTYEERMFYRGIQEALETLAMPIAEKDLSRKLKDTIEQAGKAQKSETKIIELDFATNQFKNQGETKLTLRVSGSLVQMQGVITPTKTLDSNGNTMYHITTLPEEYAPSKGVNEIVTVCQGSGTNIWTLCVRAQDHSEPCTVKMYRYRAGSTYNDMAAGNWMPVNVLWMLDNTAVIAE